MIDKYMKIAIKEAENAYKYGEVPVGCIIVQNNKIISKAYNKKEKMNCALFHSEIIAIKKATKRLKNWRLNDCELYVTMEPCPMCASAIKQSRIAKVYYILDNSNNNISKQIFDETNNNGKVLVEKVDFNNYNLLVDKFFKSKRK